jgi:hypothetical protein
MKSFLQEIENKFIDLQEQDDQDKLKTTKATMDLANAQRQYNQELEKTAELTEEEMDEAHCNEKEIDEAHCQEEEIDEASNTGGLDGGAGPPRMKHAFSPANDDTITQGGYSKVQAAMDRKYERLIESYS